MQPASEHHIPDGLLASMTLLSEKPRHGVTSRKSALQSGSHEANSTAAIGLQFRCWEIASGTVDAPNNILTSAMKRESCTIQGMFAEAKLGGVALGLDAPGFVPGAGFIAGLAQGGIATASFINSGVHQDGFGMAAAAAGNMTALIGGIAQEAGFALGKAIGKTNLLVNTIATLHDLQGTIAAGFKAYNACMGQ